ncbi:MAG: histidine kinase [Lachnospiraceae bacterium]|nr:histidine kinase [Lachnospiraceae bacterium]
MKQKANRKNIWSYIKNYKFNSLLVQNFLCVVIFAALPLLLNMYNNYRNYGQEMNQRIEENNMDLLQKSSVVMDNMVSDVQKILVDLPKRTECRGVYEKRSGTAEYEENTKKLGLKIKDYLQNYPYVKSIFVYSSLNQLVIDMEGTATVKELEPIDKWYDIYWAFPMKQPYTLAEEDGDILFCTPLYREEEIPAGLLAVEIDVKVLGKRLENETVSEERNFFILDNGGQIMYWNNEDSFSEAEKLRYQKAIEKVAPAKSDMMSGGTSNVVSVVESAHGSWNYALITAMPLYTEELAKLRRFLTSSLVTGLFPSLLAAYLITFITYRPVKKIIKVIEQPHEYLTNKEESKNANELLYITSNILNTIDKKEKMQDELEERVKSLKLAQSRALQFQVDPHFLYNTLEMIKWMSVEDMGSGNRTSKLITKVSELYREALDDENMLVSLKEEINFLQLYIEILDLRYDGRVQFEWSIDPELHECKVIKFCIQPLIENAIRHGLRSKRYYGTIWIRAERRGDKMCIRVENDGVEMSASEITATNLEMAKRNGIEKANSGVGLRNINERIKLIYGMEYGLKIGRRGEGLEGMAVEITFPMI